MPGIQSVCGKGDGGREEGEGGRRSSGAGEREMLQGKQNGNVGGREIALVRGEWEHQLFALVSKGRARHCLCNGAEEAASRGAALVRVL